MLTAAEELNTALQALKSVRATLKAAAAKSAFIPFPQDPSQGGGMPPGQQGQMPPQGGQPPQQ